VGQHAGGLALAGAGLAAVFSTACSLEQDHEPTCAEGEYPVYAWRHPEGGGGTCVADGEPPPPRFTAYPPGLVPEYEEDILICPDNGKCRDGPLVIHCPESYPREPCTIAGEELPIPTQFGTTPDGDPRP
jgi:hypothetical protein